VSLSERYLNEYFAYHGYDPGLAVQAAVEGELSVRYPLLVKEGGGRLVVCVAKELEDALPELAALPPGSGFAQAIELLFEPDTPYEIDESYIGAHDAQSFRPVPVPEGVAVRRLAPGDRRALSALAKSLAPVERTLSQVSVKDEFVTGVFEGEELVGAASVVRWKGLWDVGVMVRPDRRRRGYGKIAVSGLCALVLHEGGIVQYRCDKSNAASVALMSALGFAPALSLTGAILKL